MGLYRDEATAKPVHYYDKLPNDNPADVAIVLDPMLATGGSAITALDVLVKGHGVRPAQIVFANMICCPQGLRAVSNAYPDVKIVTAMVNPDLNDQKYIVPGLGDYGDRFFNTTSTD